MVKGEVGDIYVDKFTVNSVNPFRLQNNEYKLERLQLYSDGGTILVGSRSRQVFPIPTTTSLILHNVDLADLYVRILSGSSTLYVIGTTK
jgi:hypothetical protein